MPASTEPPAWIGAVAARRAAYPGDRLSVFNQFGIGNAQVIAEALKRAWPELSRESLLAAVTTLRDFR
jgi:branched-chain amino acid transport system substrate-binding protein